MLCFGLISTEANLRLIYRTCEGVRRCFQCICTPSPFIALLLFFFFLPHFFIFILFLFCFTKYLSWLTSNTLRKEVRHKCSCSEGALRADSCPSRADLCPRRQRGVTELWLYRSLSLGCGLLSCEIRVYLSDDLIRTKWDSKGTALSTGPAMYRVLGGAKKSSREGMA